jgi:hypothetical protein
MITSNTGTGKKLFQTLITPLTSTSFLPKALKREKLNITIKIKEGEFLEEFSLLEVIDLK